MNSDPLDKVKLLKKAVERLGKRLNLKTQSFVLLLNDQGEFLNLKIIVPIEHFADKSQAATMVNDEFESIMDGFEDIGDIDWEDPNVGASDTEETDEDDWFK